MANSIVVSGRLGGDPITINVTGGSKVVLNLSYEYGRSREKTGWICVDVFGRLAEVCKESLRTGSKVIVTGMLNHYNKEIDGKRYDINSILASSIDFLDKRSGIKNTEIEKKKDQEESQDLPEPLSV